MKKIKPISLKDSKILSVEELKHLFGGSGGHGGSGSAAHTCECVLHIYAGDHIYFQPVAVVMTNPSEAGCNSACAESCAEYDTYSEFHCFDYEDTWK